MALAPLHSCRPQAARRKIPGSPLRRVPPERSAAAPGHRGGKAPPDRRAVWCYRPTPNPGPLCAGQLPRGSATVRSAGRARVWRHEMRRQLRPRSPCRRLRNNGGDSDGGNDDRPALRAQKPAVAQSQPGVAISIELRRNWRRSCFPCDWEFRT